MTDLKTKTINEFMEGIYTNQNEENCPNLKFRRASGNCLCSMCGKEYWKHPLNTEHKSFSGDLFLHQLCNGDLVKL